MSRKINIASASSLRLHCDVIGTGGRKEETGGPDSIDRYGNRRAGDGRQGGEGGRDGGTGGVGKSGRQEGREEEEEKKTGSRIKYVVYAT